MLRIEFGGKHEGVVGVWTVMRNLILSIDLAVLRKVICRGVMVSKQAKLIFIFIFTPFLLPPPSLVVLTRAYLTFKTGEIGFGKHLCRPLAFECSKAVLLYRLVA